ncbi:MAG: putative toxin-antitoxin system toxin component, PIN family [Lachnospiraceae bacterium]|nr:putative toxin-antitoxin system toxin component, PIN family [Lachnospiraceae bacterium]
MKILLDTNVLISAFVFAGKTGALLSELIGSDHRLYVSEYVDREFKEKLEMKWPDKAERIYALFHKMSFHFCESTDKKLGQLRDCKDIPVLSDAMYHGVDIILTGDKDFLEAGLENPLIYSPTMMFDYLHGDNCKKL